MKQGRLLLIVDDARISRFICHVAEQLDLSFQAVNKTDDIVNAFVKSGQNVILLDPNPIETKGKYVLRELARQDVEASIVLTNTNPEEVRQLQEMGDSIGLNMVAVLPDVFDADILKQEFISIFQQLGNRIKSDDDEVLH